MEEPRRGRGESLAEDGEEELDYFYLQRTLLLFKESFHSQYHPLFFPPPPSQEDRVSGTHRGLSPGHCRRHDNGEGQILEPFKKLRVSALKLAELEPRCIEHLSVCQASSRSLVALWLRLIFQTI